MEALGCEPEAAPVASARGRRVFQEMEVNVIVNCMKEDLVIYLPCVSPAFALSERNRSSSRTDSLISLPLCACPAPLTVTRRRV
jgi:hypothetical protein